MSHPFDRYASVTELDALMAISDKPLRKSKRVNLLKSTIKQFEQWAKAENWNISQVPWCEEGFYVERDDRETPLGKDLLHVLGHTYIQEAASMLPAALLDPKPGETILDMCSAPGSKTTQIGSKMQNRGVVIASDVQEKRIWSLVSNLQRCGVLNTIVIQKVGQWFAKHMTERFDRVLVDAPCTAQGTCRKDSDALRYCSQDNIDKMARLQYQVLEAGIHATKVGGRIVYSTCTLTFEENEMVVEAILNKFSDQLYLLSEEELELSPSGKSALKKARQDSVKVQEHLRKEGKFGKKNLSMFRLWPQTFDTEGFFSAVFVKKAPTRAPEKIDMVPFREKRIEGSTQKKIRNDLKEWYGTEFIGESEELLESPAQIFIASKDVAHFKLPTKAFVIGLPFGKANREFIRISHEMTTLRGLNATQQSLSMSEKQMIQLFEGENLKAIDTKAENGDVILHTEIHGRTLPFGRGLLKDGDILNRLPREIVRMHS